jgi:hypothetical protein
MNFNSRDADICETDQLPLQMSFSALVLPITVAAVGEIRQQGLKDG